MYFKDKALYKYIIIHNICMIVHQYVHLNEFSIRSIIYLIESLNPLNLTRSTILHLFNLLTYVQTGGGM